MLISHRAVLTRPSFLNWHPSLVVVPAAKALIHLLWQDSLERALLHHRRKVAQETYASEYRNDLVFETSCSFTRPYNVNLLPPSSLLFSVVNTLYTFGQDLFEEGKRRDATPVPTLTNLLLLETVEACPVADLSGIHGRHAM